MRLNQEGKLNMSDMLSSPANVEALAEDHHYLEKELPNQWVENLNQCSVEEARDIERKTRGQTNSKTWYHHQTCR